MEISQTLYAIWPTTTIPTEPAAKASKHNTDTNTQIARSINETMPNTDDPRLRRKTEEDNRLGKKVNENLPKAAELKIEMDNIHQDAEKHQVSAAWFKTVQIQNKRKSEALSSEPNQINGTIDRGREAKTKTN